MGVNKVDVLPFLRTEEEDVTGSPKVPCPQSAQ